MMVEYPNLPDGIVETVLPQHFQVEVSSADYEQMMTTTQKYSKVCITNGIYIQWYLYPMVFISNSIMQVHMCS